MLVLGVCGSPRRGATEGALLRALSKLEGKGFSTRLFTVRGKTIGYCQHCDFCLKHGRCALRDDMQELYRHLEEAKGLILATPVYNGGCSAQLKAVMDRTRALLASRPDALRGKVGMGIAVGGDRMGGQELALLQIHTFYLLNGVIPVSGGAFGANLGATLWSRDRPEGTEEDEEGLRTLERTVKRFAEALRKYVG
jgi:multimeric flavodoxin WrbA